MQLTDLSLEGAGEDVAGPLETPADTVWVVDTDHADHADPDEHSASPVEDNSHAGQGSVVLDIGGEIGALVLHASADLEGVEIEIRPTGDTPYADGEASGHAHSHEHDHGHTHAHAHVGGTQDGHRLLHVAVLRRPSVGGDLFAAVFPELHEGTYELYRRPAEPVALAVSITGARVTEARWPEGA